MLNINIMVSWMSDRADSLQKATFCVSEVVVWSGFVGKITRGH